MSTPRLALTPDEAAASIGVSRDTLERYVVDGLRVVRLGRRVVIPVSEIERFLSRSAERILESPNPSRKDAR